MRIYVRMFTFIDLNILISIIFYYFMIDFYAMIEYVHTYKYGIHFTYTTIDK